MMKKYGKITLITIILALITLFFIFDLKQYLSLSNLKNQQDQLIHFYETYPARAIAYYMAIYILATALSLPGAALLSLLGGALFGLLPGTVIVSFASTIGATLAFLAARFILRDWVQTRFGLQLKKINDGIEKEGAFYLFTLRLIPAIPFFVINLVMGLTPMKTRTFFWVSQVGMIPGTLVYVNAGTQLSQIQSLRGILSPGLILSFCLLGLFPILSKKIMKKVRKKKGIVENVKI